MGEGLLAGMDVGTVNSQVILRALVLSHPGEQAEVLGGAQTEPGASLSPSPSRFSLPTVFFDLRFLAQIGFLFGLNSIPHPACEDVQELRGSLGQGWGSLIREDCRLGAESRVQSCVSSVIKACLQLGLSIFLPNTSYIHTDKHTAEDCTT